MRCITLTDEGTSRLATIIVYVTDLMLVRCSGYVFCTAIFNVVSVDYLHSQSAKKLVSTLTSYFHWLPPMLLFASSFNGALGSSICL
eukprot:1182769-Amphidinium_carterae.3